MLTITEIKYQVQPLVNKFALESVEIFGSYANGKATEKSDLDFLVKFKKETPSIFDVCYLKDELSKAFSMPVDVVTLPLVNPLKINIDKRVRVYD